MAHAFDTGLPLAQRTRLRRGVIALLQPLLRANGGYLAAVVGYGSIIRGFQDDNGVDMLWQELKGRAPSIAVALNDKRLAPKGMGGFNFAGPIELAIYHYGRHFRGDLDGRMELDVTAIASDTADPGLEIQMEHTEELVIGQYAGQTAKTIKAVVPESEEELRTEDGFTLWVQRYAVTVTRTIDPNRGAVQMLEELRANVRTSDMAATAIAASPAGATMIGNVATFQTLAPHGLVPDALVVVAGVGVAGYNGSGTVLATPDATHFTVTLPVAGLAASGGGTVSSPPAVDIETLV